jgi:single-stranded DNA-binding protein
MNNLNSVLIEGVVLEAPLFRQTGTGRMVTTFKIESKRVVDGESVDD